MIPKTDIFVEPRSKKDQTLSTLVNNDRNPKKFANAALNSRVRELCNRT